MRFLSALLAACFACGLAATAATAKPLDGSTQIRDVKVLRPTEGTERGSLVVWVRARHAGMTASGRNDAVAGTAHQGVVQVRVSGLGRRTAVRDLASVAGEHGYTVRFAGAGSAGTVDVRVTATQSLDLDGDGERDATSQDTSSQQGVTPTPVAQTIAPANGTYGLNGRSGPNGFAVQGGHVAVFWVSSDKGCENDVTPSAPIDPVTGGFTFNSKGVKASGTFTADDSASVDASWQGWLGAGGPKCTGALPSNSPYGLVP